MWLGGYVVELGLCPAFLTCETDSSDYPLHTRLTCEDLKAQGGSTCPALRGTVLWRSTGVHTKPPGAPVVKIPTCSTHLPQCEVLGPDLVDSKYSLKDNRALPSASTQSHTFQPSLRLLLPFLTLDHCRCVNGPAYLSAFIHPPWD